MVGFSGHETLAFTLCRYCYIIAVICADLLRSHLVLFSFVYPRLHDALNKRQEVSPQGHEGSSQREKRIHVPKMARTST